MINIKQNNLKIQNANALTKYKNKACTKRTIDADEDLEKVPKC